MSDDRVEAERSQLERAFQERGEQLYEARGALAEAVATVTAELNRARQERDRAQEEIAGLRDHIEALEGELGKVQREFGQLHLLATDLSGTAHDAQAQLAALRGIRAVRWIARSRDIAHRVRGSLG